MWPSRAAFSRPGTASREAAGSHTKRILLIRENHPRVKRLRSSGSAGVPPASREARMSRLLEDREPGKDADLRPALPAGRRRSQGRAGKCRPPSRTLTDEQEARSRCRIGPVESCLHRRQSPHELPPIFLQGRQIVERLSHRFLIRRDPELPVHLHHGKIDYQLGIFSMLFDRAKRRM